MDEDRCYNLLREMELVNEDGYYNYGQKIEPDPTQEEEQKPELEELPSVQGDSVPVRIQR
jgi:hypothetical protein